MNQSRAGNSARRTRMGGVDQRRVEMFTNVLILCCYCFHIGHMILNREFCADEIHLQAFKINICDLFLYVV